MWEPQRSILLFTGFETFIHYGENHLCIQRTSQRTCGAQQCRREHLTFQELARLVWKGGYEYPKHLIWFHKAKSIQIDQFMLVKPSMLRFYDNQTIKLCLVQNTALGLRPIIDRCQCSDQRGRCFIVFVMVKTMFTCSFAVIIAAPRGHFEEFVSSFHPPYQPLYHWVR